MDWLCRTGVMAVILYGGDLDEPLFPGRQLERFFHPLNHVTGNILPRLIFPLFRPPPPFGFGWREDDGRFLITFYFCQMDFPRFHRNIRLIMNDVRTLFHKAGEPLLHFPDRMADELVIGRRVIQPVPPPHFFKDVITGDDLIIQLAVPGDKFSRPTGFPGGGQADEHDVFWQGGLRGWGVLGVKSVVPLIVDFLGLV